MMTSRATQEFSPMILALESQDSSKVSNWCKKIPVVLVKARRKKTSLEGTAVLSLTESFR